MTIREFVFDGWLDNHLQPLFEAFEKCGQIAFEDDDDGRELAHAVEFALENLIIHQIVQDWEAKRNVKSSKKEA